MTRKVFLAGLLRVAVLLFVAGQMAVYPAPEPTGSGRSSANVSSVPQAIPGRRIPERVSLSELGSPDLAVRAVPLPQANTLSQVHC